MAWTRRMNNLLPWAYFVLTQLVSAALMVIGWVILLPLAAFRCWTVRESLKFPGRQIAVWRGGVATWLWGNEEDGVIGNAAHQAAFPDDRIGAYLWSAWRNPVNNLRFVVKWIGGPFYRWENATKTWYFQCGWYPNGYPVFSAGRI